MANKVHKEQKAALIEYLKENEQLRSGKFDARFTHKRAQQEWMALTNTLNAMPGGAQKDWKQWRRTWIDMKKNSKAKASECKRQAAKTGGGSCGPELPEEDNAILSMLPNAAVEGHENVLETNDFFDFTLGATEVEAIDMESHNESSQSTAQLIANEHFYTLKEPSPRTTNEGKGTKRRMSATRMRTQSLQMSQKLENVLADKKEIMAEYYARKMKFLDKQEAYFERKLEQGNEIVNLLKELKDNIILHYSSAC